MKKRTHLSRSKSNVTNFQPCTSPWDIFLPSYIGFWSVVFDSFCGQTHRYTDTQMTWKTIPGFICFKARTLDCTLDDDICHAGQYIQQNTKHHHINTKQQTGSGDVYKFSYLLTEWTRASLPVILPRNRYCPETGSVRSASNTTDTPGGQQSKR